MTHQGPSIIQRLRLPIILFILTMLIGTIGFMATMKIGDPVDALYFTLVTLTTTGYGDYSPEGHAARIFTIIFLLGGLLVASYTVAILIDAIVEGEIEGAIGHRRTLRKIKKLHNHTIICGYGRIGEDLAESFTAEGLPFVVIENHEEHAATAKAAGHLTLHGDATDEEILREAGIETARTVVPVLASDADNVFIVMSARQLNSKVTIVARATDQASALKMERAGADRVVRPLHIGANHLIQAVLRPTVVDFFQVSGRLAHQDYAIEEVLVTEDSKMANRSLGDIDLRKDLDVIVIGIKRPEGDLVFNPSEDCVVHSGDTLVAAGEMDTLKKMSLMANGHKI